MNCQRVAAGREPLGPDEAPTNGEVWRAWGVLDPDHGPAARARLERQGASRDEG